MVHSHGAIGFPGGLVVKNLSANAGDLRDTGLIPGEGNDNSLQYSYLGNPMDTGVWKATFHGTAETDRAKQLISTWCYKQLSIQIQK